MLGAVKITDMEKGIFSLRSDCTIPTNTSMYECKHCKEEGKEHTISDVSRGYTDRSSCWGEGVPVTYRVCSGCQREDGGWVSADIVGGGW